MTATKRKHYYVEILGGDHDGATLDGDSPDPLEQMKVRSIRSMTHNCQVGKAFHGASLVATDALVRGEITWHDFMRPTGGTHKYCVFDRIEDGDVVWIRLKYSVRPLQKNRASGN